MANQNLFLPVCVPLIFLFVLAVAIMGMRSRLRFAKRLFSVHKDENRFENWRKNKNKHRLLALMVLVSIIGILLLSLLILVGALSMSNILLTIFVVLILSCLISGILILVELEKITK
jgi:uncharacterized membrane protein YbaN (DUF454 family)